mmetsp:Transcript_20920/g.45743  ORF Transcript_20920/g.45743 Transcript_20920/m.45743 type:complete len:269 (-) Transcript_20920:810-1616(-)
MHGGGAAAAATAAPAHHEPAATPAPSPAAATPSVAVSGAAACTPVQAPPATLHRSTSALGQLYRLLYRLLYCPPPAGYVQYKAARQARLAQHAAVLLLPVLACIAARSQARGHLGADLPALVGWAMPPLLLLLAPAPGWLEEWNVLLAAIRGLNFLLMGLGVYRIPSSCVLEVYLRFHLDVPYEVFWYPLTEPCSLGATLLLKVLLVSAFTLLYRAVGAPMPLLRACLVQGLGLAVAVGWEAHQRANYHNHLARQAANRQGAGKAKAA